MVSGGATLLQANSESAGLFDLASRSLSPRFLLLVYLCFFEKKAWVRVVLFPATIPIAIQVNAARVTITGIMTQVKPELAEGFFHESTGWVVFIGAMAVPILFYPALGRILDFLMRGGGGKRHDLAWEIHPVVNDRAGGARRR